MENKFKIGDVVKVIEDRSGGHDIGTIGKITKVDINDYSVETESEGVYYHYESDLELYIDTKSGMMGTEYDNIEEFPKVTPIIINPTKQSIEVPKMSYFKLTEKDKYLEFHAEVCRSLTEITAKKNADYTGKNDNPFANFTSVENGICSTEQGFLVRMNDKFERIKSFVSQGDLQVKEESVSDTLKDLANYCILFMGYLNQKKNESDRD